MQNPIIIDLFNTMDNYDNINLIILSSIFGLSVIMSIIIIVKLRYIKVIHNHMNRMNDFIIDGNRNIHVGIKEIGMFIANEEIIKRNRLQKIHDRLEKLYTFVANKLVKKTPPRAPKTDDELIYKISQLKDVQQDILATSFDIVDDSVDNADDALTA